MSLLLHGASDMGINVMFDQAGNATRLCARMAGLRAATLPLDN
jgi:hypothetical protein